MARQIFQQAQESPDGRRTAPAALRNTGPLIDALRNRLPKSGRVLELASGTGQHAAAFAAAFPDLHWLPSDSDPGQRASIAAWRRAAQRDNLAAPLDIDASVPWPEDVADMQAVLVINLLHLVPDPVVVTLFRSAHAALGPDGVLMIYGPFLRGTRYASNGDRQFDATLRARDPSIGYKSREWIDDVATGSGFVPIATDAMPANNLLVSFAKR